jgi:hypothetical protein
MDVFDSLKKSGVSSFLTLPTINLVAYSPASQPPTSTMIPSIQSGISFPSSFSRTIPAPACEQAQEDSTSDQFKSQSIPICKNLHRTLSEVQLCADEQLAEQRDYAFFSRIVNGISKSQTSGTNQYLQMENQVCLAHIIQTRLEQEQARAGQQEEQRPTQKPEDQWFFGLSAENVDDSYSLSDAIARASSTVVDDDAIFDLDL